MLKLEFQFLIGRLDTRQGRSSHPEGHLFQFLIGRLDTPGPDQLLLDLPALFQFLIGRLDTGKVGLILSILIGFQFLIGRLDTMRGLLRSYAVIAVSIPHR